MIFLVAAAGLAALAAWAWLWSNRLADDLDRMFNEEDDEDVS